MEGIDFASGLGGVVVGGSGFGATGTAGVALAEGGGTDAEGFGLGGPFFGTCITGTVFLRIQGSSSDLTSGFIRIFKPSELADVVKLPAGVWVLQKHAWRLPHSFWVPFPPTV